MAKVISTSGDCDCCASVAFSYKESVGPFCGIGEFTDLSTPQRFYRRISGSSAGNFNGTEVSNPSPPPDCISLTGCPTTDDHAAAGYIQYDPDTCEPDYSGFSGGGTVCFYDEDDPESPCTCEGYSSTQFGGSGCTTTSATKTTQTLGTASFAECQSGSCGGSTSLSDEDLITDVVARDVVAWSAYSGTVATSYWTGDFGYSGFRAVRVKIIVTGAPAAEKIVAITWGRRAYGTSDPFVDFAVDDFNVTIPGGGSYELIVDMPFEFDYDVDYSGHTVEDA